MGRFFVVYGLSILFTAITQAVTYFLNDGYILMFYEVMILYGINCIWLNVLTIPSKS